MDEVVQLVSDIDEFVALSNFLQDPDLDKALEYVIKLKSRPAIESSKVPVLIVQLQAISAMAQMKASTYQNVLKSETNKKNVYKSLQDAIDKLVAALKYQARI